VNTWHFGLFWALVGERDREAYALARTGLWSATPNSEGCDRSGELTLLVERQVTGMVFDGTAVWFTTRPVPGYFQYIEYRVPVADHAVGYKMMDEEGRWLDACCS
jgi:hypothetical protein